MLYSHLLGTGGALPERVVANSHFSYLVEDADEWIHSRTGIAERRFAAEHESTSDLATTAAKNAIENAGISPLDIDCIIVGTSTPDMCLPATACMVQKNIGAKNAAAFDMNAVCSSFVFAVETADNFIKSGKYKTVLVIGADTYSKILDFQDKGTSPLFGDGAGAVILGSSPERKGILSSLIKSDGNGWELIQVPSSGSRKPITAETIAAGETTFKMEGKKVFIFATEVIPQIIHEVAERAGIKPDDIDHIIPHQANVRIIDFISKKTGIPKDKFLLNLDRCGNTAAASVGLALDENRRNGVLKPRERVLIMGFGGGLSWGGMLIQL
ncbi:ketoacyl-ACP synthase III [Geobacter pelophilus]|jgi:3-oxoacyl-[acyl-carrier-protein] synthase-3|uniref:Beta-ketoacyl-[acyl-carrier-protein] synthase III n=1 Tax=Geoanaerobacter pelophilus TaxID=60036 RepID=A0AAW4L1J5_9BACT|nr:beta-ketoacyl-ACP synthase III [Geoanaerobacter pelophilus]MBT0664788.1 ketoacyl-ACP synthase III [Geoanaerobacter pelophilus]